MASAMLSASSPPVDDDGKSSLNFDDFDKEFGLTKLVTGSSGRALHSNADIFTMQVDSGTSGHLVDDERVPRPRHSMRDCKKLKGPTAIVTAGCKKVFAAATVKSGGTSSIRLTVVF